MEADESHSASPFREHFAHPDAGIQMPAYYGSVRVYSGYIKALLRLF
jgi:hypothetical protein